MDHITVIGIRGLPIIHGGDDIASFICRKQPLLDQDILCIASTIYSKSKGYTKSLGSITPGERAERLARLNGEDPRFVQAVLDASADVIMEHPFILSELSFGHIGVRAGVDQSNIEDGMVIFLPPDPMKAADEMRSQIKTISGKSIGVIITDHNVKDTFFITDVAYIIHKGRILSCGTPAQVVKEEKTRQVFLGKDFEWIG
jgi:coenzyme F420-0:L-glutamate ligase/coenzyme F420-1:gamma-L-glutamate ligase